MLPGRIYENYCEEGILVGDQLLKFDCGDENEGEGTGYSIWDGSFHLVHSLGVPDINLGQRVDIVELGSGCGVGGICLGRSGRNSTDQPPSPTSPPSPLSSPTTSISTTIIWEETDIRWWSWIGVISDGKKRRTKKKRLERWCWEQM